MLLSCKHCKPYERKTTRGVADCYEHLINCSEFLDNHPEQHAEMQAVWLENYGAAKVVQQEVENQPVAKKQKVSSGGTQGCNKQHLTSLKIAGLYAALLLMFVMCNITFSVVEHSYFQSFIRLLRPNFTLPGACSRWCTLQPIQ